MESGGKVRVYDDGRCPFCQWAQRVVARYDTDHCLEFCDYHDPAIAAETPFSFQQLHQKMHVQTPDGQWHAGFLGWIAVLAGLPRWRWLASVLGVPPLRWAGSAVYRLVAGHRYQVPDFLLRWLGAPPPCGQPCAPGHGLENNN